MMFLAKRSWLLRWLSCAVASEACAAERLAVSLRDGGAIGDVIEVEEGLTCLHSLTFGDVDLGDEACTLGADLGIVSPRMTAG